jgi:hypothetical protein
MPSIFSSRKFYITLADLIFSSVLFFGTKYLAPTAMDDVKFLIGAIQPVVLMLIAAYTIQNVEGIRKDTELAMLEPVDKPQ